MAAAANITRTTDITINPREVDFVTRFGRNWGHLRAIMGIMRPIRKTPGTVLKSKTASVTLQSGTVAEGDTIPYSAATVTEKDYATLAFSKYRKGVTLEAIDKYGYDVAIQMTDDEFLAELTENVTAKMYQFIQTGTLTGNADTFSAALATAQGKVVDKWRGMHRNYTRIVGFCNVQDAFDYLGAATIGQQVTKENGLTYLRNFLGLDTLILLSSTELPAGKVIATPADNIVLYYADPSDADFSRAGLSYTTGRGATNLIGFHVQGAYDTAVSESYAIIAMELFAEYLDGIAVISFAQG